MTEELVIDGDFDSYLVLDGRISEAYSHIVTVEVNNNRHYGCYNLPAADLGENIKVGDAVKIIFLLRPNVAIEESGHDN